MTYLANVGESVPPTLCRGICQRTELIDEMGIRRRLQQSNDSLRLLKWMAHYIVSSYRASLHSNEWD